jgi:hypothetical protein
MINDEEYLKKVREQFYIKIANTKWDVDEPKQNKGRKSKIKSQIKLNDPQLAHKRKK